MVNGPRPPVDDADGEGAPQGEFERALRVATASLPNRRFGPRTAPIPELRRALAGRFQTADFDHGLRRLQREGTVELAPHAHPEFLRPSETQAALEEAGTVIYLLRWLT